MYYGLFSSPHQLATNPSEPHFHKHLKLYGAPTFPPPMARVDFLVMSADLVALVVEVAIAEKWQTWRSGDTTYGVWVDPKSGLLPNRRYFGHFDLGYEWVEFGPRGVVMDYMADMIPEMIPCDPRSGQRMVVMHITPTKDVEPMLYHLHEAYQATHDACRFMAVLGDGLFLRVPR